MINPLLLKPAVMPWIRAGIVLVLALGAVGAGWAIENWRKGAELEKLRGENTLLKAAGDKCREDVRNVRTAMQALMQEADKRELQALEAMRKVEPEVKTRTVTITKIKELPPVPLNMQCEAIKEEQIEYVQMRRGNGV
jgi:hypothetical protein